MTSHAEIVTPHIDTKNTLFTCAVKGGAALCIGMMLGYLAFSNDSWLVSGLSVCSLTFAATQFSAMLA